MPLQRRLAEFGLDQYHEQAFTSMDQSLGSGRIKDKEKPPIHLLITRWRSAGQQGIREDMTTMAHSLKNESLTHIETIDGGLFSPLPF
jgi:hypothetical protein